MDTAGRAVPSVGVVIVTLNSASYITKALESIRQQNYPTQSIHTVVVDNGSADDTVVRVRDHFPEVRLLAEQKNHGFAGGNNIGMRSVAADYYALVNPDAAIAPDWFTVLVSAMQADSTIGVAGCKILYGETDIIQHAGGVVEDNALTYHIGDGKPDNGDFDMRRDVDYVMGAAMLIRGSVARRLGYLPEEFYPAYYEEADFCAQVRRLGLRVVYIPEAVARHDDRKRPPYNELPPGFLQNYHKNRFLYAIRNMQTPEQKRKFREAERTLRKRFTNDRPTRMMLRHAKLRNWRYMLRNPWLLWV